LGLESASDKTGGLRARAWPAGSRNWESVRPAMVRGL